MGCLSVKPGLFSLRAADATYSCQVKTYPGQRIRTGKEKKKKKKKVEFQPDEYGSPEIPLKGCDSMIEISKKGWTVEISHFYETKQKRNFFQPRKTTCAKSYMERNNCFGTEVASFSSLFTLSSNTNGYLFSFCLLSLSQTS